MRHVLSRLGSDIYFPRVETFGYLKEFKVILQLLNGVGAKSYIFFRRCTLPSPPVLEMIDTGGHKIGIHPENSRSFESSPRRRRYWSGMSAGQSRRFQNTAPAKQNTDFTTTRHTSLTIIFIGREEAG